MKNTQDFIFFFSPQKHESLRFQALMQKAFIYLKGIDRDLWPVSVSHLSIPDFTALWIASYAYRKKLTIAVDGENSPIVFKKEQDNMMQNLKIEELQFMLSAIPQNPYFLFEDLKKISLTTLVPIAEPISIPLSHSLFFEQPLSLTLQQEDLGLCILKNILFAKSVFLK